MKICIIGKSKRLSTLESNLADKGFLVETYKECEHITDEINCDYVVLPIPSINKDGFINTTGRPIAADDLFSKIPCNTKIITCGISSEKHTTIDLNTREDFAYLNAVPTAEGAIFTALENSEISLFESNILITGFGRVSKLLADRLRLLCKNITVTARSQRDLSLAEAIGYNCFNLCSFKEKIYEFDLIFQTIPSPIITKEIIEQMNKKSLIIELSSKSAGTDCSFAEFCGIKVVHAPGLPEKISPITAGNILTKSVLSIIDEYK